MSVFLSSNTSQVLHKDSIFITIDIFSSRGKALPLFFMLFMTQRLPGKLRTNFTFYCEWATRIITARSSHLLKQSLLFLVLLLSRTWLLRWSWTRRPQRAPSACPRRVAAKPSVSTQHRAAMHPSRDQGTDLFSGRAQGKGDSRVTAAKAAWQGRLSSTCSCGKL